MKLVIEASGTDRSPTLPCCQHIRLNSQKVPDLEHCHAKVLFAVTSRCSTHRSFKGPEADFVVIIDVAAPVNRDAFSSTDFYVGCSRAKHAPKIISDVMKQLFIRLRFATVRVRQAIIGIRLIHLWITTGGSSQRNYGIRHPSWSGTRLVVASTSHRCHSPPWSRSGPNRRTMRPANGFSERYREPHNDH